MHDQDLRGEGGAVSKRIYCTSFCNFGHRVLDGKPVGHECYVLPPAALKAEMHGEYEEAIRLLEAEVVGPEKHAARHSQRLRGAPQGMGAVVVLPGGV
jgi:hypothetical protein